MNCIPCRERAPAQHANRKVPQKIGPEDNIQLLQPVPGNINILTLSDEPSQVDGNL